MADEFSPEIDHLIAGYRKFRKEGWHPNLARWKELREGQEPQVMVIACSDSRVDPSQIFDADPGEIFVVRNVAALVPPFETTPGHHGVSAALEFAVQVLKVKEILVMGHGMCGGCKAALTQPCWLMRASRLLPVWALRGAMPSAQWNRQQCRSA
jgi:carbonic anhydrase